MLWHLAAPRIRVVLLIVPQQIMDGDAFLRAAAALHGAPGISGSPRTAAVSPFWHRAPVVRDRTALEVICALVYAEADRPDTLLLKLSLTIVIAVILRGILCGQSRVPRSGVQADAECS